MIAVRPDELWRPLGVALPIFVVLTSLVSLVTQSTSASTRAQAADPCASVTPGPPPPSGNPPVASFNAPAKAQVGHAVSFDGSGSHSATATLVSWCWMFGDGTHAFGAKVSHTYAAAGQEAVALTVSDAFGLIGRAFSTINVTAAPASFRLVLKQEAHDDANRLRSGERVRLYGSVVPARRGQVVIERSRAAGHFSQVHAGKLDSRHGVASFSITIPIVHSGTYRARLVGTKIVSRSVRLHLRPGRAGR